MANKFKKGDAVIWFHSWDGKGAFFFARLTVESCGKKQMTLKRADGQMLTTRIYASQYDEMMLAANVPDAGDEAVKRAALYIVEQIQDAHYRMTLPAYRVKDQQERVEFFTKAIPTALDRTHCEYLR